MTITRSDNEGRPHGREELSEPRTVALLGFRTPLSVNFTGIFTRCQLHPVACANAADACRVLETIVPDALVIDTHAPALQVVSPAMLTLLELARNSRHQARRVHLVVLTSAGLSALLRTICLDAGAVLLGAETQTHRAMISVIRRICGMSGSCCASNHDGDSLQAL